MTDDDEFMMSHRFDTRGLAVAWAEGTRTSIEKGWQSRSERA